MRKQESPCAYGAADRPAVLLVGRLARTARPGAVASAQVLPCASGSAALRAAADPRIADAVEAVFSDCQLADMSGTGLLDRISTVLPGAARVLLEAPGDGAAAAGAPPSALVTDVWALDGEADALMARFLRERRALRRMHALQCQLDELHGALETLRDRYVEARRSRDRLVDSVGVGAEGGASRWWQDFRQLTSLAETGCAVHRRALCAARLQAEFRRAGFGAPALPAVEVHADPAVLREMLGRLAAGMRRQARGGWHPELCCGVGGGLLTLDFAVALAAPRETAELLDPFGGLDGGPSRGAPLDLPVARALAQAHGEELVLDAAGDTLRARLRLPCREPADRPGARRSRAVVPALDRTL